MKFYFFVLTIFCVSVTVNASTVTPNKGDPPLDREKMHKKAGTSFSSIFYSDYENTTLFIDFQNIYDQLTEINIFREDQLMLEDFVEDLPANTIYEINLGVFREGTYTLELVTNEGIKIHKEIVIE